MQFTTPLSLLALALSASAMPAVNMGAWNATIETAGSEQQIFALFVSDSYPIGIGSQCNGTICRPSTFSWEYDGAGRLIFSSSLLCSSPGLDVLF